MGSWDGTLPAALPSGFVPSGSDWEAIRDAIASLTDPWNTYTPTWQGSVTNPVVNNGSVSGAYVRSGKTGMFAISVDAGSTTTFGSGNYTFSLPPSWTAIGSGINRVPGVMMMRDNSAATHNTGAMFVSPSGTVISGRLNGGNVLSNTAPWTWAQSDFLYMTGILELV